MPDQLNLHGCQRFSLPLSTIWGIEALRHQSFLSASCSLSLSPNRKKKKTQVQAVTIRCFPFLLVSISAPCISFWVNRCFPWLLSLLNWTPITSRLGSSSQGPNQRLDFNYSLYCATTVYVRGVSIYICICIRGLVSDPSLLTRIDFFTHTLSPTHSTTEALSLFSKLHNAAGCIDTSADGLRSIQSAIFNILGAW